jgi:hypothetical protein
MHENTCKYTYLDICDICDINVEMSQMMHENNCKYTYLDIKTLVLDDVTAQPLVISHAFFFPWRQKLTSVHMPKQS